MMYKYLHHNAQVSNLLYENQLWITPFWPENRTAEEKASWQLASLHQDEAEEIQTAQPEIPFESKENLLWTKCNVRHVSLQFLLYSWQIWQKQYTTLENLSLRRTISVACQHIKLAFSILTILKCTCEQENTWIKRLWLEYQQFIFLFYWGYAAKVWAKV